MIPAMSIDEVDNGLATRRRFEMLVKVVFDA